MTVTREAPAVGAALDRLISALEHAGWKVTDRKATRARAQCPAHGGNGQNLSIFSTETRVNGVCHSRGCDFGDVLAALGMTWRDRYHERKAEYVYDDGRQAYRVDGPKNGKNFQQSNTKGTPTLYRRAKVKAAVAAGERILLVEGEEDVHAAEAVGAVATTAPMGATNFHLADVSPLAGADVVAMPDQDGQGEQWTAQVEAAVRPIAKSLRFVRAATGKDLCDHLAAGHALADLVAMEADTTGPTVVTLSTVKPERVQWLWPGRLPVGKLIVIDGDPSTGKSTLTNDMAARVSTGSPWPDGAPCPAGDVLLLSAEDGLADTIAPRLTAAGADLTRVHVLTEVPERTEDGQVRKVPPSLPRDLPHIHDIIKKHKVRLLVIDVLMAFLSGKVDSHRDQDVRGVLHRITAMAEATGCTVICIRHMNKSGGGNALYRGGGSIGIVGAARAAFLVARDPDDSDRRVFAVTKSNLAVEPPSLAYRLVDAPEHGCARVEWETDPVHLSAADLLHTPDAEEASERSEAAAWLEDYLKDEKRGGSEAAGKCIRAAAGAGISKTTLTRARKQVGVSSKKSGMEGGWVWFIEDLHPDRRDHEETEEPSPKGRDSSVSSVDSSPAPTAPLPRSCADCGTPVAAGIVRCLTCRNAS